MDIGCQLPPLIPEYAENIDIRVSGVTNDRRRLKHVWDSAETSY
jgi:cyclopropane fatty-acyl-phospholipid synthase-like methyltransferase